MAAIVVSLSSDRDEREIDEHHDESNTSDSSSDSGSSCSSSGGNTTDEQYSSGVPGVPLEVLQEEMRTRAAFGSSASPPTSAPRPPPQVKRKLCIAVLWVFLLGRMRRNLTLLGVGTRSRKILTLAWLSVVNGVVLLNLE